MRLLGRLPLALLLTAGMFVPVACSEAEESPSPESSPTSMTPPPEPAPSPEPSPPETTSAEPTPTPSPTPETLAPSPEPSINKQQGGDGPLARIGDRQAVITTAMCREIDGAWVFSGGEDETVTAAVRTVTGDPMTVDSASIIFSDGLAVQVQPGEGSAVMERNELTFTVTGTAQRLDLGDPDATSAGEVGFLIRATCDQ